MVRQILISGFIAIGFQLKFSDSAFAQSSALNQKKLTKSKMKNQRAPAQDLRASAFKVFKEKKYADASVLFYNWSRKEQKTPAKIEAKYFLGLSLYRQNLKQIASFPLIDVVRSGPNPYQRRALNLLVTIARHLDEKSLLNFSMSKLTPESLTAISKSVFLMERSDLALSNNKIDEAMSWAQASFAADPKNEEALYQLGSLSLVKSDEKKALTYFQSLFERYKSKPVNDKRRGLALLNIARTHYQMQNWVEAAEFYRQIPKDHFYYRDAQKELSWTLLRGGRFRSSLSPLQSLLTPFYEQFYDPEILLLSSTILVFSCQYEQAQALTEAFDKSYSPIIPQIEKFVQSDRSDEDYFQELKKGQAALAELKASGEIKSSAVLPFFVLRTILAEVDMQSRMRYLRLLDVEVNTLNQTIKDPKIVSYGMKIIDGRRKATKKQLAQIFKASLNRHLTATKEFNAQLGFLKYEILNGLRLNLREQIAGEKSLITDEKERSYYAQNGYRIWPMQGEFWRDEIGSYQYVGKNLCKK